MILIKLEEVFLDYDNMLSSTYDVGLFSSYDKVEKVMTELFESSTSPLQIIFLTSEIEVDKVDYYGENCEFRQYRFIDNVLTMVDKVTSTFSGYKDMSEYKYKVGDVIDYFEGERIQRGIVADVPPRYEKGKENYYDWYDDCYLVYGLGYGDTHGHISKIYIIGLSSLNKEEIQKYKDKLRERSKR